MKKAIYLIIVSAVMFSCNDSDLDRAHYFTPAGPGRYKQTKDSILKSDSLKIKNDGKAHF